MPLLGTPVLASVKERQPHQPARTMKPSCTRPLGRWTLEKSLCSSCRRDGRKHLIPRLTLSPYRLYPNRRAQRRLRSYRSSSRYGSAPRVNLSRGGCEAFRPHRRQPPLSLIDGDRLYLFQISSYIMCLFVYFPLRLFIGFPAGVYSICRFFRFRFPVLVLVSSSFCSYVLPFPFCVFSPLIPFILLPASVPLLAVQYTRPTFYLYCIAMTIRNYNRNHAEAH